MKLDQYEIKEKIGQGSFGIVYKAFRRDDHTRAYAIKCVNKKQVR